jgi:hypothetical protein
MAHLIDDETVAKMGHPVVVVRPIDASQRDQEVASS